MPPERQGTDTGDLLLRPALRADLAAIAEVHLRARVAAEPAMPPLVHPPDDVRAWFAGWDLTAVDVWVAERAPQAGPVGYAQFTPTWLDGLYVDPAHQGTGVGTALLEVVKAHRPGGFDLWVFESNLPARALYARHGFTEVRRTDGRDNMERQPDIQLHWGP